MVVYVWYVFHGMECIERHIDDCRYGIVSMSCMYRFLYFVFTCCIWYGDCVVFCFVWYCTLYVWNGPNCIVCIVWYCALYRMYFVLPGIVGSVLYGMGCIVGLVFCAALYRLVCNVCLAGGALDRRAVAEEPLTAPPQRRPSARRARGAHRGPCCGVWMRRRLVCLVWVFFVVVVWYFLYCVCSAVLYCWYSLLIFLYCVVFCDFSAVWYGISGMVPCILSDILCIVCIM